MTDFTRERVLSERRDEIVAHLVAEVRRKEVPPPGLSRSRLVDDIPRFLDEILQHCVSEEAKGVAAEISVDEFGALAKCANVGGTAIALENARRTPSSSPQKVAAPTSSSGRSIQTSGSSSLTAALVSARSSFLTSSMASARGRLARHGGLGIGLTIAKHIVELHTGTNSVFSGGDGMCATFVGRFPTATSEPESEPPMPSTRFQAPRSASVGLEGVRVLVVDDDEDALELLRVLLETAHIEVKTAESAERALAVLEGYSPDVVISDIAMPGDDGYWLIRHVRTLPSATSATPAIALTAYARNEDRKQALVEGFNAHLAKPAEPSELLATIADLTGRPQTPQSN